MKTSKILNIAVMTLMMCACSNNEEMVPSQLPTNPIGMNGEITITAIISAKNNDGMRAVNEGESGIEVNWATHEHIAILYEVSSEKKIADAEITAVDGTTGEATITFSVDGATTDNTPCTLVYPLSAAKADYSGVKTYSELFSNQNGLLNASLDVRVGDGKIQVSTPSLDVTTQPTAQFAIFKFTLGLTIDATHPLTIKDGTDNVISTITPTESKTIVFVSMPVGNATYKFEATNDNNKILKSGSANIVAGMYYKTQLDARYPLAPTSVTADDLGCVIAANGNIYLNTAAATAAGTTTRAVIAYAGSVDKYFNHFVAIAPEDASDYSSNWTTACTNVNAYASHHPITIGSTTYNSSTTYSTYYDVVTGNQSVSSATATTLKQGWRMPTVTDWRYIFAGIGNLADPTPTSPIGVSTTSYGTGSTLRNNINTACGNTKLKLQAYWASSVYNANNDYSWWYGFNINNKFGWNHKTDSGDYSRAVFAY